MAVGLAYENAALNGIGKDRYTVRVGDVLSDGSLRRELEGSYDIVVANIVADVIIPLAAAVEQFMAPDGLFLASGIFDDRADEVAAAIQANGLAITRRLERSGWCAFSAQRR